MSKLGFLGQPAEYPEVRRRLDLGGYHPDLKGNFVEVWLNWSRDFNDRMAAYNERVSEIGQMPRETEAQRDDVNAALDDLAPELFELTARYWGCEVEEVQQIYELDAELWRWVSTRANEMRTAYQDKRKKGARRTTRS